MGYRNSFFCSNRSDKHSAIAIASVRAGNVIGGGDWSKDRIVPDCIKALEKNELIDIRNPNATRPWQHVLEPLSGYLTLASKMYTDNTNYSSAWNFGPDSNSVISVKQLVSTILKHWNSGNYRDLSDPNAVHEANLLSLDCSKAKSYLKWKPILDIDTAIKLTVDWYKNYKSTDVYNLCKEQICHYTEQLVELCERGTL